MNQNAVFICIFLSKILLQNHGYWYDLWSIWLVLIIIAEAMGCGGFFRYLPSSQQQPPLCPSSINRLYMALFLIRNGERMHINLHFIHIFYIMMHVFHVLRFTSDNSGDSILTVVVVVLGELLLLLSNTTTTTWYDVWS